MYREFFSFGLLTAVLITTSNGHRPPPAKFTLPPSTSGAVLATRELCEDLNPPGYSFPQRTRSPFAISTTWDEMPDLNIYIDSPYSLSYEGWLVQVRSDITKKPIGSTNGYGTESPTRAISCAGTEDTLYMAHRKWRQTESLSWFAPIGFNGSDHRLTVVASVILGPFVFWQHEVPVPLRPVVSDPYTVNEDDTTVPPPNFKTNEIKFFPSLLKN